MTTAQNQSIEQFEKEIRSTSYVWNSSQCCLNPTPVFEIRLEHSPSFLTIECAMHEGVLHFSRHARGATWGGGHAVNLKLKLVADTLREGLVMMLFAAMRELSRERCKDAPKLLAIVREKYLEVNQLRMF